MKAIRLFAIFGLLLSVAASTTGCNGAKTNATQEQTASAEDTVKQGSSIFDKLAADMVKVEGDNFVMGSPGDSLCQAHSVTLSDFSICKYEVTQELWEAVMGTNPSDTKGGRLPVVNVSWDDCQTFIGKLNALTGKHYRLPTEAEWEFACRGGKLSKGYKYSGGNVIDKVAWYGDDSDGRLQAVGQKQSNELGLHDMSGNVWEWCQDIYGNYDLQPQTNPTGPAEGTARVCRGGSWIDPARYCQCTLRNNGPASFSINTQGFRLAL